MEAIILAGGLGTRLRSEVKDVPKPMALIQSKPFVEYLLDLLISEGVTKFIFSVGHKADYIQNHFNDAYRSCPIQYAVEKERLGTGGAIRNAMKYVKSEHVVVANGDSIFIGNLKKQFQSHLNHDADVTLALKKMTNIERYGTVELDKDNRIVSFNEKQYCASGFINTGVYIFNVDSFNQYDHPVKFSIEKDFFEKYIHNLTFNGFLSEGYFLDIGIPKDYKRAQFELGIMPFIDHSWTIFLDRDGVINKKIENDYVKKLDELVLLDGATSSICYLSNFFGKLIIVTNQQGIGKKLMTDDDVNIIHEHIRNLVNDQGGRIDAIYYAPQLAEEDSIMRKPNIGMALEAKKQFPEIEFEKSIIIGDSRSDIEFGKNAHMYTVLITSSEDDIIADSSYESLKEFTQVLKHISKIAHTQER